MCLPLLTFLEVQFNGPSDKGNKSNYRYRFVYEPFKTFHKIRLEQKNRLR